MNSIFQGIWPAMFTPLDESGNPSLKEVEKLTDKLVTEGVPGLYILGSTGQGVLFSQAQREEVANVVLQTVAKRIPVMVQVGSMTSTESSALAKHAQKAGASAVSSVGPIYFGGGADMVLEHYRQIAESTDLPFFPYQLGNNSIQGNLESFIDELMKMPQVAGMKLTTTDLLTISAVHNHAGERLRLFSGADELLCHSTLCGTVGAIGSMYNFWWKECNYVRNAFMDGDFELGRSFMLEFQRLIFQFLPNVWTFFRQAMQHIYQIDIGPAVRPVGNTNKIWSEAELHRVLDQFQAAAQFNQPV
ncbi:dihydrodipicolinate synthase family protein [Membranihabitans marinus]|uniref:dihydrodipicolinate synthase family protein n=1 Tax=Membranihabitans marinus TaxID=1227546 RepID=UPI001F29777F|nr:dihydrodipicolinate synthase family protein [Membranihabitans marinus]